MPVQYKVISLWQPWATLWVLGEKLFETRGFITEWRGTILVHAAKKVDKELCNIMRTAPFAEVLRRHGYKAHRESHNMPLGALVGAVNIDGMFDTKAIRTKLEAGDQMLIEHMGHSAEQELAFGNYADGRFAWHANEQQLFKESIPLRGMQGLFNYTSPNPLF